MMKYQYNVRFVWLRKIALLSLIVGMPALFSFTTKPVYPESVSSAVEVEKQELVVGETPTAQPFKTAEMPEAQELLTDEVQGEIEESGIPNTKLVLGRLTLPVLKTNDTYRLLPKENLVIKPLQEVAVNRTNEVDLRPDQIVISRAEHQGRTYVRFIERTAQDTRVTIAVRAFHNRHWVQFEKGFSIVDEASKDIYRIRSVTRGIELNKTCWINGMEGRMVEFTLVFPPLGNKVKRVSILNTFPEEGLATPSKGSDWTFNGLLLSEFAPTRVRLEEYDDEGRPIRLDNQEGVTLRPDQISLSPYRGVHGSQIVKIDTSGERTLVVLHVPIVFDRHWLNIGKGYCIIDRKTGREYRIEGIANGIEINRTLWVEGCEGRAILLTLIFPKLKEKVKSIDFYNKYPDAGIASPPIGRPWMWTDIKIKDYQEKEYRRIVL